MYRYGTDVASFVQQDYSTTVSYYETEIQTADHRKPATRPPRDRAKRVLPCQRRRRTLHALRPNRNRIQAASSAHWRCSCVHTNVRMCKTILLVLLLHPNVPSVLWHCWLGGRKGIRPEKKWVVRCWHGYLSGARCRLAYGPADATATHCLLLQ